MRYQTNLQTAKMTIIKKIILMICLTVMSVTAFAQNVQYHGPIYNVFFHPNIAYPKIAFTPDNHHLKYIDSWFVTTREFNKIILELYEKGFVLFSPKDLFEEKKDEKGNLVITRKQIFLPAGKKPLILSLDDYNFYPNMKKNGTIHRFWIDQQNKLATVTNQNNNETIIRYDQEVPQLLENFIETHPDFSYNHARGIFALTGYNGIFGYDTHKPKHPDYSSQLNEAKKVIRKLKEMGWEFGSHSYFHFSRDKQTEKSFEESEKRWIREVSSLVGYSPYYIFPFGDSWDEIPVRMQFLKSIGYKYFFGVSSTQEIMIRPGAVIMSRFPMDGLSLRNRYTNIKIYVTPARIMDEYRLEKTKKSL